MTIDVDLTQGVGGWLDKMVITQISEGPFYREFSGIVGNYPKNCWESVSFVEVYEKVCKNWIEKLRNWLVDWKKTPHPPRAVRVEFSSPGDVYGQLFPYVPLLGWAGAYDQKQCMWVPGCDGASTFSSSPQK